MQGQWRRGGGCQVRGVAGVIMGTPPHKSTPPASTHSLSGILARGGGGPSAEAAGVRVGVVAEEDCRGDADAAADAAANRCKLASFNVLANRWGNLLGCTVESLRRAGVVC